MRVVKNHQAGDKVSKHIESSRAHGKEMNRLLDSAIKHLREAADALERAGGSTPKKT
jgi:hypothetical protein